MREFKELKEVDVKLSLLRGASIRVENLVIKPYTLKEIEEYGYTKYMENLQWISISIDDFMSSIDDENKLAILNKQKDKLKTFDFYYKLGGVEFLAVLIGSLKMIFRTDDVIPLDDGVIAINFVKKGFIYEAENGDFLYDSEVTKTLTEDELTVIHRDNFDDIVEVIKLHNYLKKVEKKDSSPNPADEQTKKLMQQMEENRRKVEAKKKAQQGRDGDEDIDIADIVSSISSKSNSLNKFNIWDFTLYQLYDEYSRLEIIDNYDFSIQAMMAGAEKVDLTHWSSKI